MDFDLDEFIKRYRVHPESVSYLKETAVNPVHHSDLTVERARERRLFLAIKYGGDVEFEGTIKDLMIPSPYDLNGIPVTTYQPKSLGISSAPTLLVYFHGGGNVVGSRRTHDIVCKIISKKAECIVVNVEYRLAPEYKFPANQNDANAAVDWVMRNKHLLGGTHKSKVGVGGDSSGGRLAAIACHEVPGIDFQILIYPGAGYAVKFPSNEEFQHGPDMSNEVLNWYKNHYASDEDFLLPRTNLLLQTSYSNLPPALFIVAELDRLRDGTCAYCNKLSEAGVETDLLSVEGTTHGFFALPGHFKECCAKAYDRVATFIQSQANSLTFAA
ncbi:hypothetical protein CHS0354_032572 [Potamilus streckersoni]|uniref:Alpha/beta hydrolase fold-3 domain-containing protein n=1 Tax=Potamilus streckersoni TaxID=2493646 RepID=A0AAE0SPZ2_9BIVA|nr:hypothetical protein CHS0354_032572 [Potamilus streckersoni]